MLGGDETHLEPINQFNNSQPVYIDQSVEVETPTSEQYSDLWLLVQLIPLSKSYDRNKSSVCSVLSSTT